MRKIEDNNENFIDNVLIDICEYISDFVNKIGLTPNMITTISLFFGLFAAFLVYKRKYVIAVILWTLQYFFDCLDGYIARKYNQTSKFGDYYDHISDVIKLIALLFALFFINSTKFFRIIWILIFFGILMIGHLGCQEKIYNNEESGSLSLSKILCPNRYFKDIQSTFQYTKYFGCGTFNLVIILCILYYKYTKK